MVIVESSIDELLKEKDPYLFSPEKIPANQRYFKRRGSGFNLFCLQKQKVSFDNQGTCINICYDY